MTLAEARKRALNPQCFFPHDSFIIIDGAGGPVQSSNNPTRDCEWLNDHEIRCGRRAVYTAIPVTRT